MLLGVVILYKGGKRLKELADATSKGIDNLRGGPPTSPPPSPLVMTLVCCEGAQSSSPTLTRWQTVGSPGGRIGKDGVHG